MRTWEMDAVAAGGRVWGVIVEQPGGRQIVREIPALRDIRGLLTEALATFGDCPNVMLLDCGRHWHGAIGAVLREQNITVRIGAPDRAALIVRRMLAERIAA
jgi:hypothetical protein